MSPPVSFRRVGRHEAVAAACARRRNRGPAAVSQRRSGQDDFVLVVAWLLAALRDCGPYPVLALAGEQGIAKSTFASVLRALIDPSTSPLRALPREDRDLFIAASNGTSCLRQRLGLAGVDLRHPLPALHRRRIRGAAPLYRQRRDAVRRRPPGDPQRHRGHHHPARSRRPRHLPDARSDPEKNRRPEKELWRRSKPSARKSWARSSTPRLEGLWRLPDTRLEKLPRMADFALWVTACEGALWEHGTFAAAYRATATTRSRASSRPTRSPRRCAPSWRGGRMDGESADLLGALVEVAGEKAAKAKTWPDSPRALVGPAAPRRPVPAQSRHRDRLRPREKGGAHPPHHHHLFRSGRYGRSGRWIPSGRPFATSGVAGASAAATQAPPFSGPENGGNFASTPSTSSNPNNSNGLQRTVEWTVGPGDTPTVHPTVHSNPLKNKAVDGLDGMDAKIPPQSEPKKTGSPGWSTRL